MKNIWDDKKLIDVLKEGGVVVMPTDTIYGIVGRADNQKTVERLYKLKKRALEKKCIILIGDWNETKNFGIDSSEFKIPETDKPTSFVLENTAFRLPLKKELRELLLATGPLIAPSANREGLPPAQNIEEAQNYFGLPAQAGDLVDPVRGREGSQRPSTSNGVDLYVDGGEINGKPSKLIQLRKDGSVDILRD